MARTMRVHPTTLSQKEGTEDLETNPSVPQQEEQPDATEGKVIADNSPVLDYEG